MGATLPAIARWVETDPEGVSWLGFFYGGNIAGAVFGCLLAGFYLLRVSRHGHGDLCRRRPECDRGRDRPGLSAASARYEPPAELAIDGMRRARGRRLGRVSGDRPLRDGGAGCRGGLDPPALVDARRHGVHLLVDPGRVPDRPGDRQQPRGAPGAAGRVGAAWRWEPASGS